MQNIDFQRIIKRNIKRKGYTLTQLSNILGISKSTLSMSIANNPTLNTLNKIANVVGCSVSWLLTDNDAPGDNYNNPDCPATDTYLTDVFRCPDCCRPFRITINKVK